MVRKWHYNAGCLCVNVGYFLCISLDEEQPSTTVFKGVKIGCIVIIVMCSIGFDLIAEVFILLMVNRTWLERFKFV